MCPVIFGYARSVYRENINVTFSILSCVQEQRSGSVDSGLQPRLHENLKLSTLPLSQTLSSSSILDLMEDDKSRMSW